MSSISNLNNSTQKRTWHEDGGVIFVPLPPTDGTTGREWIERSKRDGTVSPLAISTLWSKFFHPTTGGMSNIDIIRGAFFVDDNRKTSIIRAEGKRRGYLEPGPEDGCLLREVLTDADVLEMGLLRIVTMHEPLADGDGVLRLLTACGDEKMRQLCAHRGDPTYWWEEFFGFAFRAP